MPGLIFVGADLRSRTGVWMDKGSAKSNNDEVLGNCLFGSVKFAL